MILNDDGMAIEAQYWIRQEAEIRQKVQELNLIRADMVGVLTKIGVPERWLPASFNCCNDLPANLVKYCRKFADDPMGILYMSGIPGAGKTWLAVSILRHCLANGVFAPADCCYVSERSFLDDLRGAFDYEEKAPRFLPSNHPCRARFMVFDDLGSTRLTDWGRGEVANLIEKRHGDALVTVVTSNVDPDHLAKVIDGRVASRIAESRQILCFPEKDLRLDSNARWQGDFNGDVLENAQAKTIAYLKTIFTSNEEEIQGFIKSLSNEEIIELIRRIPEQFRPQNAQLTLATVLGSGFWRLRLWQLFCSKNDLAKFYWNEPRKTAI